MRAQEFIAEAQHSIRDQIIHAVDINGGSLDDYFVRFTTQDHLGFSDQQIFGHFPDVDDPDFDIDRITAQAKGRRVLWFYPLKTYLRAREGTYAMDFPYVWLVKLKPDAWLQTVRSGDHEVKPAPRGKQRVGILRMGLTPAALFFQHGFDVVGKYYDYAGQHQRHGQVKLQTESEQDHTFANIDAWENGKKDAMNFRPKNVEKYHLRHKYRSDYSDGYNVGLKRRDRSINPETGKPYIKFGPNGPINPEQNVWEGNEFNQCFDQACKLYDQAVSKRLQPKLVQVADFQGDGSRADARWIKLPQHVWQHYVVIVGDQVLDPTATQFGDDMPTKYPVSNLDKLWAKQYQIRPRPGVAENTIESVDVDAIHAAALREHLLLNPTVLEGRDDTNRIKSFLDLHSTPRPHVGDQYVYASVQITPLADYVNIAHFGSQHQLIDLTHDHAYFDIDGTTKRFPEKGSLSGDSLSQIYFFDSKKDFDQFAIMLSLKLSDYKHSSQLLDEPAMTENFADGKNPQDRGDSARHGIPRHATIAQLEKIRSSKTASPRKKQLAHWQINMRRGRAKSRK